jgi:outer membrane protein TolC
MNRGLLIGSGLLLTGVLALSLAAQTPAIDDFEVSSPSPGAKTAAADELSVRKAYVAQLEAIFKTVQSLHGTGRVGGEADKLHETQTALEIALAELATAENKPREMIDHYTKAAAAADEAVKSMQSAYDVGSRPLSDLLAALKTQAQLKLTLASMKR